jgi:hypothetical protein
MDALSSWASYKGYAMNIFNRRNEIDRDNIPNFLERPKLIEDEIANEVKSTYAKRPSPARLAEELELYCSEFEQAVANAENAARAYCAVHAELTRLIEAKLEDIEVQRRELTKLREGLKKEVQNEEAIDNPDLNPTCNASASENPVREQPTGQNNPLPFNRR